MTAYYNEIDPFAAAWLRELIKDGLIADGVVDERSIAEVQPNELSGFDQVHFFAGIGGWSYALRLAGWPDDRPVWTGSCPCQPFSTAGKQRGTADERHLWPEMFRLIRECRPATIFGEQVEAAVRLGWVDGVRGDLEGQDYAFGFHVLGAHSVGSPHIRQRIYWVANRGLGDSDCKQDYPAKPRQQVPSAGFNSTPGIGGAISETNDIHSGRLADSGLTKRNERSKQRPDRQEEAKRVPEASNNQRCGVDGGLAYADGIYSRAERKQPSRKLRLQQDSGGSNGDASIEERATERLGDTNSKRESEIGRVQEEHGTKRTRGYWDDSTTILCRDGKRRRIPTQSEIFPLAHGVPNRVGTLRGAGNAIVPQTAAEFVKAFYGTRQ